MEMMLVESCRVATRMHACLESPTDHGQDTSGPSIHLAGSGVPRSVAPHRRAFGDLPQALDAIDATRTRYVDFPKLTQLPSGSAAAQDENSPPGRSDRPSPPASASRKTPT